MDGLYRLPSTAGKTDSSEPEVQVDNDEDRMFLTYDDPRRYAQVQNNHSALNRIMNLNKH